MITGMNGTYGDSTHGMAYPRVLVCVLTLNSASTVTHALRGVLSDGYPLDRVKVLVVDGGSTDGTVEVAEDVLRGYGVEYEVMVTRDSIPEARNRCIEVAVAGGFDYLLFVDSDVVPSLKGLVECLLKKGRERYPSIIQVPYEQVFFNNTQRLSEFSEGVLSSRVPVRCEELGVRPSKYVGMGFTLIPVSVLLRLKFDPNLTFREDRLYSMYAWLNNVKVLKLIGNNQGTLAYDVNVVGLNDIYVNTSFANHFKGLWRKVVALAYTYYDGSTLKTLINFLRDRYGRRVTAYALMNFSFVAEFTVALSTHSKTVLRVDELLTLLSFTGFALVCLALYRRVRSVGKALKAAFKFMLFSAAQALLLPVALQRYGKAFREVLRKASRLKPIVTPHQAKTQPRPST